MIRPLQVMSIPVSGQQAPLVPLQAGYLPAQGALQTGIDINAIMNMMMMMMIMVMMMKMMTGMTKSIAD